MEILKKSLFILFLLIFYPISHAGQLPEALKRELTSEQIEEARKRYKEARSVFEPEKEIKKPEEQEVVSVQEEVKEGLKEEKPLSLEDRLKGLNSDTSRAEWFLIRSIKYDTRLSTIYVDVLVLREKKGREEFSNTGYVVEDEIKKIVGKEPLGVTFEFSFKDSKAFSQEKALINEKGIQVEIYESTPMPWWQWLKNYASQAATKLKAAVGLYSSKVYETTAKKMPSAP